MLQRLKEFSESNEEEKREKGVEISYNITRQQHYCEVNTIGGELPERIVVLWKGDPRQSTTANAGSVALQEFGILSMQLFSRN